MYSKYKRDFRQRKESDDIRLRIITGDLYSGAPLTTRRKTLSHLTPKHDANDEEEELMVNIEQDPIAKEIKRRNHINYTLSERSKMRMQTWLTKNNAQHDLLTCLEKESEVPLQVKMFKHTFRDRDSSKDIGKKAFRVQGNYKTSE
jgi:hypothetical protein